MQIKRSIRFTQLRNILIIVIDFLNTIYLKIKILIISLLLV